MQVEDLTSPAGTDDACVGVLEAVHPSQPIMLDLGVAAAQREVKMPSQSSPIELASGQVTLTDGLAVILVKPRAVRP